MSLHDSRFKRLHQLQAVSLDWMRYVSHEMDMGEVDPDSLEAHPVAYVSDQLTQRMADLAWSFSTSKGRRLLYLSEFQSSRDPVLVLRQIHYALGQLLAGHEAKRFRVRDGFPIPVVVSLYTGDTPWTPKSFVQLLQPGAETVATIQLPMFYFDMHHMDTQDIPDRDLLSAIFHIERQMTPQPILDVLRSFVQTSRDPNLNRELIRFTAATVSRWGTVQNPDGTPLISDLAWDTITSMEELEMQTNILQQRLDQWIAQGEARGEARGETRGEARGEARDRLESLLEVAAYYLDTQTLEACRTVLSGKPAAEMPRVGDVLAAALNTPVPAQAVEAVLRGHSTGKGIHRASNGQP